MATRLECGCKYQDEEWLAMCASHEAEWRATHDRWAREKLAAEQPTPPTEDIDPWT